MLKLNRFKPFSVYSFVLFLLIRTLAHRGGSVRAGLKRALLLSQFIPVKEVRNSSPTYVNVEEGVLLHMEDKSQGIHPGHNES